MADYSHVQNCRELIDGTEATECRTREYIKLVFPDFTLESGLEQADPFGSNPFGSKDITTKLNPFVDWRAQAVVDRIFKSEPKEAICNYLEFTQQLHDADGHL